MLEACIMNCFLCSGTGTSRCQIDQREIRWCERCGIGFTVPPPVVDYEQYTLVPRDLERWLEYGAELVEFAARSVDASSWLDFGAGAGELLLAARQRGVSSVVGVDLDAGARALAAERGVTVYGGLADLGDRRFDVISASHVLEHLDDPIAAVESMVTYLEPEGVVVVSQPDPTGLLPRMIPTRWPGWVPSEHRWHFTLRSMTTVFERAGLNLVASKRSSLDHRLHLRKSLPIESLGKIGKMIRQGDQFLAVGRRG